MQRSEANGSDGRNRGTPSAECNRRHTPPVTVTSPWQQTEPGSKIPRQTSRYLKQRCQACFPSHAPCVPRAAAIRAARRAQGNRVLHQSQRRLLSLHLHCAPTYDNDQVDNVSTQHLGLNLPKQLKNSETSGHKPVHADLYHRHCLVALGTHKCAGCLGMGLCTPEQVGSAKPRSPGAEEGCNKHDQVFHPGPVANSIAIVNSASVSTTLVSLCT